jgi:Flp pilus assembly protein TadG
MIRRLRALHRDDEAQAILELALALPLVVLMLLGLLQFGFVMNTKQQLEGVARQGARTFALTGDIVTAQDVLRVAGRQVRDFDTRATIEVNIDPPDTGLPRALSAKGRVNGISLPPGLAKKLRGYWVEVVVTYDFPNPVQATLFGSRILPAAIPLTTRAVARVEVDLR